MKTAWKLLLGLTLMLATQGCCSWCGQGTGVCRTNAPAWDTCPTPTVSAPSWSMSQPVVPQTATLAGNPVSPQMALR